MDMLSQTLILHVWLSVILFLQGLILCLGFDAVSLSLSFAVSLLDSRRRRLEPRDGFDMAALQTPPRFAGIDRFHIASCNWIRLR